MAAIRKQTTIFLLVHFASIFFFSPHPCFTRPLPTPDFSSQYSLIFQLDFRFNLAIKFLEDSMMKVFKSLNNLATSKPTFYPESLSKQDASWKISNISFHVSIDDKCENKQKFVWRRIKKIRL